MSAQHEKVQKRFQRIFRTIMFLMLFVVLVWAAKVFSEGFNAPTKEMMQNEEFAYKAKPILYNDNMDGFTVIAHRGASAYAPENTMSAFKKAVAMKAEMIELDVIMSSDGIPFCFHDAELDRCTNAKGLFVNFSSDSLKKLDAGSWFSDEYEGEHIPTLDEALAFAKGKIAVNIEIKTESVSDTSKGGVEEKVLELVNKHEMLDNVIFSSFDYRALVHLRALEPAATTALLYNGPTDESNNPVELVEELQTDAFNCSWKELSPEWLKLLKENGIPFNIYTVNKAEQMTEIIELGAAGIFSDYPDVLLQASKK